MVVVLVCGFMSPSSEAALKAYWVILLILYNVDVDGNRIEFCRVNCVVFRVQRLS